MNNQSEVLESNQALLVISEPCRHGHRPPKLRRQGSNLRLASNSRASYRSTTPEYVLGDASSGRRGSRTLNGDKPHPFSRRDTAGGSPSESGPGRSRTCSAPGKNRQLSPFELRSQRVLMWPAGIEPAARRVSSDRSTSLSYGHLPWSGRGWTRTSSLLFVRQALFAIELLAPIDGELRDKDSNLDLHVQSVGPAQLDDPGTVAGAGGFAPATCQSRNATWRIARARCSVFISTRCQIGSTIVAWSL